MAADIDFFALEQDQQAGDEIALGNTPSAGLRGFAVARGDGYGDQTAGQLSPAKRLTSRAYHSATLLLDGRVLVAGGATQDGKLIQDLELWSRRTNLVEKLQSRLDRGRRNHTARLLANGSVDLRGGLGAGGAALGDNEAIGAAPDALASDALRVEESIPQSGATGVAVDSIVAVRFAKPVQVTTVNQTSVSLKSADQEVKARVVAAEAGMLAFVSPEAPLSPGTAYTLTLDGVSDGINPLASTEITFNTNAEKAPQQAASAQPTAGGGPQREKEEILPRCRRLRG